MFHCFPPSWFRRLIELVFFILCGNYVSWDLDVYVADCWFRLCRNEVSAKRCRALHCCSGVAQGLKVLCGLRQLRFSFVSVVQFAVYCFEVIRSVYRVSAFVSQLQASSQWKTILWTGRSIVKYSTFWKESASMLAELRHTTHTNYKALHVDWSFIVFQLVVMCEAAWPSMKKSTIALLLLALFGLALLGLRCICFWFAWSLVLFFPHSSSSCHRRQPQEAHVRVQLPITEEVWFYKFDRFTASLFRRSARNNTLSWRAPEPQLSM